MKRHRVVSLSLSLTLLFSAMLLSGCAGSLFNPCSSGQPCDARPAEYKEHSRKQMLNWENPMRDWKYVVMWVPVGNSWTLMWLEVKDGKITIPSNPPVVEEGELLITNRAIAGITPQPNKRLRNPRPILCPNGNWCARREKCSAGCGVD